jgi:hypothetical protein
MKVAGIVLAVILGVAAISAVSALVFAPVGVLQKTVDPDNIISNYEEFQTIYNTCQKLDTDLATIKAVPDTDNGTNGNGVFGFTPEDIYIEHNMKYIVSTVPLHFAHPVVRLAVVDTDEAKHLLSESRRAVGTEKK